MSGKRKANQVSGEAVGFTGNPNKKRTADNEHNETVKDRSGQLESMVSSPLHMELSPDVTSTNRLGKSDDESTNDNDRFLSLADRDRTHLLGILPEDVWRLVFKELNDSADFENLSNSSLYFRELLLPQRTQFLFHNVCKHLVDYYLHSDELEHEQNYHFDRHSPEFDRSRSAYENWDLSAFSADAEIMLGGWFMKLVNLRPVCRTWSSAVENLFQNHPIHFMEDTGYVDECTRYSVDGKPGITNADDGRAVNLLGHFAETHENTTRNPFLSRLLPIALFEGNENQYSYQVLRVIRLYGLHVWYTFIRVNSFASGIELYSRIADVLRLMPNLKVVRLVVRQQWEPSAEESEELQAEINRRPLPNLQNLQMLTVDKLPPPLFQEVLRRNAHVSRLIVRGRKFRYRWGISEVSLPNLKKLDIPLYSEADFLGMDSDLVDWPLTELHLNLKHCSDFIDWQQVFNILENKFKNSLNKLNLSLPVAVEKVDKDRIYREGHTFKLNLPQVKSLFVEMRNLSCLDFVLPMRHSITDLQFSVKLKDHKDIIRPMEKVEAGASRTLKLLSCVRRPLESNVWTLFPNLNKLRYTVSSNESQVECDSVGAKCWVIERKGK